MPKTRVKQPCANVINQVQNSQFLQLWQISEGVPMEGLERVSLDVQGLHSGAPLQQRVGDILHAVAREGTRHEKYTFKYCMENVVYSYSSRNSGSASIARGIHFKTLLETSLRKRNHIMNKNKEFSYLDHSQLL